MKRTFSKNDLTKKILNAKKRVRLLGVLAIDLDWESIKESLYKKINSGEFTLEIICEADHYVRMQSLISSDTRFSGENRSYEMGNFENILLSPLKELRKFLKDNNCKYVEPSDEKQCFSLRTSYIYIPVPVVNIDDDYYITMALTKFNNSDKFEKIDSANLWYDEFVKYFAAYLDSPYGTKKYSTEYTAKGNKLEVIAWYKGFNDEQTHYSTREQIGLLPRDSFSNTSLMKTVVWGLIFTRDGKLLIHQRGKNAKDNQGLWDKSVGGHIDAHDIDSAKAFAREVGEELYKTEKQEQGGHDDISFMAINPDKMIFLGEWKPNRRYTIPFDDVNNNKDDYFYFRIDYSFSTTAKYSPRLMPNGSVVDVYAFADVFACIAPSNFNINVLKNSKFMVVDLYELKEMYQNGTYTDESGNTDEFKVSPDVKTIINSSLWDQLSSFSDYIKKNLK